MPFLSRQLTPLKPVPSDLVIAQSFEPVNIVDVASSAGILPEELTQFGTGFAKVKLDIIKRLADRKNGKYVVVTAMNPTPLGEGKSTTTIGLAQALGAHLGKNCIACIRQPSQGPTFSVKGGAAGGGYSQVIPMDKFNLHLTGDIHAIAAANNLLAAAIDTRIYHEKTQSDEALYRRLTNELKDFTPTMLTRLRKLGIDKTDPKALTPEERVKFARLNIDPATITWNRVVDVNDRVMRSITIGEGPLEKGCARKAKFEITVASELMAILALSADLADMRRRFGDIVVAKNTAGESVTAEDIGCAGAMAVLMKDAIEPTLMQTLEATPVLVHAGPFANIAQGNSSIVADRIALKLVGEDGIVLTEAGFGADMGCEKFFDIKCRESGLHPNAAVIVATVRALKFHGGIDPSKAAEPHEEALREGTKNLLRHIENTAKFGIPSVVVLNRFTTDTDEELALVTELCKSSGAFEVVVSEHWARGGAGAVAAAEAVERACNQPSSFKLLYPNEMSLVDKIRTVCKEIYRADDVVFEGDVLEKLADFERRGFGNFPVCMAKTQYSFSANPDLKGAPLGFSINIKDVRANCGARFVFPYCGDISTMPGLPTRPGYYLMDIDLETGKIIGLS